MSRYSSKTNSGFSLVLSASTSYVIRHKFTKLAIEHPPIRAPMIVLCFRSCCSNLLERLRYFCPCSIGNSPSDLLPVRVLVPFRSIHLDHHYLLLHPWTRSRDDSPALAPCRHAVRFTRGERVCIRTVDYWQWCWWIFRWCCWSGCGTIPD